jgi:hypothetical protein
MNYAQTSMSYLNVLPPRIRQLVYDFDGRYKVAKDKCIELIRQRGLTPIGIKGSDQCFKIWEQVDKFNMKTFHHDFPEYYAELDRRVKMYRSRIENGHVLGVTTHMKRAPKSSYKFKDALGCYNFGQVFDTVIMNGIAYKSTERVSSVALEKLAFRGVTTVVKCIDVLDPVFKKTVKGRQTQRVKVYRALGVSENGIPKSIYKKVFSSIHYEGEFGFTEAWYNPRKCNPPASLSAVTEMLEQTGSNGDFTYNGNNYTICIKTGTGIIYQKKNPVGYVTKKLAMRFTVE